MQERYMAGVFPGVDVCVASRHSFHTTCNVLGSGPGTLWITVSHRATSAVSVRDIAEGAAS